ncbi:MAG: hypothetical protein EP329_16730 [Deltaproteobacteria bacterium]|nr:MAG: hypothetical protein EP329_16730 [Deltaproteobacteria bacterium]
MRQGILRKLVLGSAIAGLLVGLTITSGCENNRTKLTEEQSEGGLGLPTTSSNPKKKITIDPRCELNEEVVDPKADTPEWVIYQLLDAARTKDDSEDAFQKFYAQFDESQAESWVRQQFWPRARKHVTKYLLGDPSQGVVYKICDRREDNGKIKIFIQSTDPTKSNPPITVKKDDGGKWKVVFYTP